MAIPEHNVPKQVGGCHDDSGSNDEDEADDDSKDATETESETEDTKA
ncbi:MAG: hypothetical protein QM784_17620 [Polyangiaceae bacterium]